MKHWSPLLLGVLLLHGIATNASAQAEFHDPGRSGLHILGSVVSRAKSFSAVTTYRGVLSLGASAVFTDGGSTRAGGGLEVRPLGSSSAWRRAPLLFVSVVDGGLSTQDGVLFGAGLGTRIDSVGGQGRLSGLLRTSLGALRTGQTQQLATAIDASLLARAQPGARRRRSTASVRPIAPRLRIRMHEARASRRRGLACLPVLGAFCRPAL